MIYNWTISAFDCDVKKDKLSNVIVTIHWRYSATDANDVSAETYGVISLEAPTKSDFTKFEDLTKAQVVGWLENALDVPAMQAQLAAQIELTKNPVSVTLSPLFN